MAAKMKLIRLDKLVVDGALVVAEQAFDMTLTIMLVVAVAATLAVVLVFVRFHFSIFLRRFIWPL